jgi:hypothetical protein
MYGTLSNDFVGNCWSGRALLVAFPGEWAQQQRQAGAEEQGWGNFQAWARARFLEQQLRPFCPVSPPARLGLSFPGFSNTKPHLHRPGPLP